MARIRCIVSSVVKVGALVFIHGPRVQQLLRKRASGGVVVAVNGGRAQVSLDVQRVGKGNGGMVRLSDAGGMMGCAYTASGRSAAATCSCVSNEH
jgi:hypothetical protein